MLHGVSSARNHKLSIKLGAKPTTGMSSETKVTFKLQIIPNGQVIGGKGKRIVVKGIKKIHATLTDASLNLGSAKNPDPFNMLSPRFNLCPLFMSYNDTTNSRKLFMTWQVVIYYLVYAFHTILCTPNFPQNMFNSFKEI